MVYPEAIFLACAVFGFRAVERRSDGRAAVLAAIAALARPNGFILAIALAVAVGADRSWRRSVRVALPAALAVGLWVGWLWLTTGDPLRFVHAKAAWHEVTLASLLAGADALPMRDLSAFVFAAVVLALTWRRLPVAWLVFAGLALLPSLALGILGMPRYTSICFPVFAATGTLLARCPVAVRIAVLGASGAALFLFADRIFRLELMP
jgi:hypothetical protein